MKYELLLGYQRNLIAASLEDISGVSILSGWCGGQYGANQDKWRNAVSRFVFRNYSSGLIGCVNPDIYKIKDIMKFSKEYETLEVDGNEESLVLWNGVIYSNTKKLDELIERYGLGDWRYLDFDVNHDFMSEIISIYKDFGSDVSDISLC